MRAAEEPVMTDIMEAATGAEEMAEEEPDLADIPAPAVPGPMVWVAAVEEAITITPVEVLEVRV